MKKRGIVWILAFLLAIPYALPTSGGIVNAGGSGFVNYTYYDSSSTNSYIDSSPTNDDYGLAACGLSVDKYLGAGYAYNVSGTFQYILITGDGLNNVPFTSAAADASSLCGGSGKRTENAALKFWSSAKNTGSTPAIYKSALPGKLWLVISDASTESNLQFVLMNASGKNAQLRGTFNGISLSFDEASRNVSLNFDSSSSDITFYTDASSTTSKDKTDSTHGIADNRRILAGLCTDNAGFNCSDAKEISNASSQLPAELSTGLSAAEVNDSFNYTRYGMINGFAASICIGPDLYISSISTSPSSPYPQAVVNISVTVKNQGNVNVTSNYTINVSVDGSVINSTLYADDLASSGANSLSFVVQHDSTGESAGSHSVSAAIDDMGIADCTGTYDTRTSSYSIQQALIPRVYVDGVQTRNFSYAGKPYNVFIQINDTDGNPLQNSWIKIYEDNGINLLAPVQVYNESSPSETRAVRSTSIAWIKTNADGNANFTLIPTGNTLLSQDIYNITQDTGENYSLYMEIVNATDNSTFDILVSAGSVSTTYGFNLLNMSAHDPTSAEVGSVSARNQNEYIEQIYTQVYNIFSAVKRWLA